MKEDRNNRYINHHERICKIHGICGNGHRGTESHRVTLYGLHCLSKGKKDY